MSQEVPASALTRPAISSKRALTTRRRAALASLTGAVALVAAACGSSGHGSAGASSVGVTKDSITISVSGPYSGVYGSIGQGTYTAAEVWRDQVNATGGINGRKINMIQVDNLFSPEGAISACKTVGDDNVLLAVNTIDPGNEVGCEDAAGIPVFVQASGAAASTIDSYKNATFGRAAAIYNPPTQVSFLGSSYVNAKGKKIGLFAGQGPSLTPEYIALRAELAKAGYDVVDVERTDPSGTQTSFVPQIQRMRQAGAQVVLLEVVLEAPGVIRDARAIGYDPEFVLGPLATQDTLAQASPAQYRGLRGVRYETTTETPAYAAWVNLVRQYLGPAAAQSTNPTNALEYGFFQVLGEALTAAGKNLDRKSFMAAARSIDNYDGIGLTGPFTTKGQTPPIGQQTLFPVQCCSANNTFRLLGPPEAKF